MQRRVFVASGRHNRNWDGLKLCSMAKGHVIMVASSAEHTKMYDVMHVSRAACVWWGPIESRLGGTPRSHEFWREGGATSSHARKYEPAPTDTSEGPQAGSSSTGITDICYQNSSHQCTVEITSHGLFPGIELPTLCCFASLREGVCVLS